MVASKASSLSRLPAVETEQLAAQGGQRGGLAGLLFDLARVTGEKGGFRRAALAPAGDPLLARGLVALTGRMHGDVLGKARPARDIVAVAMREQPVPDHQ